MLVSIYEINLSQFAGKMCVNSIIGKEWGSLIRKGGKTS